MGFGASDGFCYTGLGLGLGSCHDEDDDNNNDPQTKKKKKEVFSLKYDPDHHHLFPSLTLGPPEDDDHYLMEYHQSSSAAPKIEAAAEMQPHQASSMSVSSFSNSSVKKDREYGGCGEEVEVEVEVERAVLSSSRVSDEEEEGSPRKKLRLTKVQAAVLEDNFKEHNTLNPKQKQALAEKLNLRPRQVEVWFQNRRARTKLKQTEADCELLKKCCETLTEENKRLQKELQELKSLKLAAAPLYMQLPAATLSMCPSCERIGSGGDHGSISTAATTFTVGVEKPHFLSPFTHPSAAC